MPALSTCPDLEVIRQFMLGQIADSEALPLEQHLAECSHCDSLADGLRADDTLIDAMRARTTLVSQSEAPVVEDLMARVRDLPRAVFAADINTVVRRDAALTDAAGELVRGVDEVYDFLAPAEADNELGRFGPYRVLRVLGRGGMGVAFLAEDPRLKRHVALKVILDSRMVEQRHVVRFRREAEAVARLQHPNIVQVHEVGEQRGRAYIALEYVPGGSLADRLAGQPQAIGASAELVRTLAVAIHHAHLHGVVHRDLKPANILMGESAPGVEPPTVPDRSIAPNHPSQSGPLSARPRITDFGLAKRIDEVGLTQTGDLLGTPGYMAPELSRGEASDSGPLVDVYALGALLYELLTGRAPFVGATVVDTLEQLRTLDPVSPRRLRPELPRDLETICLKCLSKEPARRYATALELADDLGRSLRGEPIRARPISAAGRLWKWARRRQALATLLVVSIVFVQCLFVGILVHSARLGAAAELARQAQQRADRNYREARDVLRQMLARVTARGGEPIPQLQELRREQQEDALAFFLKIAEQDGSDPDVRFDVAQALQQAGVLQSTLGRVDEATRNLHRAEQQFDALAREFPNEPRYRLHQAESLKTLGGIGKVASAAGEDCLRRALAIAVALTTEQPDSVAFRSTEADVRITLGSFLFTAGNPDEPEEHFRRAAQLYETLAMEQPESTSHRLVLAKAYLNLSVLMQTTQRSAHEFHDKAEATLLQLHRDRPDDDGVIDSLAVLRVNWAYVQENAGEPEAALAALAENVAMLDAALRREPNHMILRDRLYRTHGVRATILDNQRRFQESTQEWQRTVELCAAPAQADFHRLQLALAYARSGQHERADTEIEEWNRRTTSDTPVDQLLQCAHVYCVAIVTPAADSQLPPEAGGAVADAYAARAIDFIRRAKQSQGLDRWNAGLPAMRDNEGFKPLRDYPEFQRLLAP